jgi:hypothetical protein
MKVLKSEGDRSFKKDAVNDAKLLYARLSDLVVEKASEEIKEKYAGKKYIWIPSDAEEQDPVHALNYGKTFVVGEGEQPGERWGCRCGMEILADEDDKADYTILQDGPPLTEKQKQEMQEKGEKVVSEAKDTKGEMSKNHIAQNNEELKELFYEDGRLKKLDELKEKDLEKIKSIWEKMGGADFFERELEAEQIKYIYEGLRQVTDRRPDLLDKITLEVDGHKVERIKLSKFVKGFSDRPPFPVPHNVLGRYVEKTHKIYILIKRFEYLKEISRRDAASRWHPPNTDEYGLIFHEFWHALSYEGGEISQEELNKDLTHIIAKVYRIFKDDFKNEQEMINGVSRYADDIWKKYHNPRELFADAFMDLGQNQNNANKISKKLIEIWSKRKKIKEKWQKRNIKKQI